MEEVVSFTTAAAGQLAALHTLASARTRKEPATLCCATTTINFHILVQPYKIFHNG